MSRCETQGVAWLEEGSRERAWRWRGEAGDSRELAWTRGRVVVWRGGGDELNWHDELKHKEKNKTILIRKHDRRLTSL